MRDRYDVIVVGIGGMGSAAVAELAARGVDVLGLERYDVPHDYGSAHGTSRIVRRPDATDRASATLLERGLERWRDLEADVDRQLLYRTGSIDVGPADGDALEDARRICEATGLEYDRLSSADLSERFPAFAVPETYAGIYQPEGGVLVPDVGIVAQVTQAHRAGATIRARERVVDWRSVSDGVRVETDHGAYESEALVVTAGPWIPQLVEPLEGVVVPERQLLGWFQPGNPDRFGPDRFPVWTLWTDEGRYFGTPVHDVPGCTVGRRRTREESVDPDAFEREPTQADERLLRSIVEEYVPTAAGPTMRLSTSLSATTADDRFVLDTLPDRPEVVVGTGCSDSAFAFAPAIGEVLADLALEGTTEYDVDPFSLDRF
ncbi:N-methyl-L-tryptophan oxidase [Halopiger goleimassiliensis]|uniref:N-methyl-L-tryptophan oxidase n=1 Tax=Halopiger goleimassiliensis TaxID=1293048 RepID=UPI000677ECBB|nr:N-methyl-L-tryptophan oxidase [Halopiger goleimassiliensis]